MSDKDLSKPIGFANKPALEYAQYSGCEFEAYASDDVQGYDTPVYSAEYVQSLLGRIAALESRTVPVNTPDILRQLERENNVLLQTGSGLSASARDVIAERLAQVNSEGFTAKYDDGHTDGQLATAAACYAEGVGDFGPAYKTLDFEWSEQPAPSNWPWNDDWWKPRDPRGDLVRAGALILAEIDRFDRSKELKDLKES